VNRQSNIAIITWRFYLIISLITLAVAGLGWRIFDLAILDQHFLRAQGDERVLRLVSTPAFRGMIVDRNNFPLAVSTTVFSAWMNPQEFTSSKAETVTLAKLLGIRAKDIYAMASRYQKKKREFIYLKRALSPEVANQIKTLNLPGVYLQQEYRRYYPEGEITAHVVGFTNIDDHGQEGLELGYDGWLIGEAGKKWVIKDRIGRVISDVQTVSEQQRGRDLVLSIDRRIQYLAYRALLQGVKENQATSGSAVVLDVKTGEVLAMVNQPSFNPNNRPARMNDHFRNRAVTDTFEPGSTIKAFTVASALESKRFKPDSVIDTSPGWMRVGKNIVKDPKNNGLLSLAEILQLSSNMGAAKMVLALPPNQLWSLLHRVGFGEVSGIGFPGEQSGSLVKHEPWGSFTLATLSFGYGLSSTALQLARAYAVLANGGVKLPVSLLRVEKAPQGERVLDPTIAGQMLLLLESVVSKGKGTSASVPGYRVAGKTGTSKLTGQGGYQPHHYNASFVGIAPLADPRFVVAVVIHDPQGKHYYGGEVSAPVFEKIMEGALRILDIPPDAVETSV
jgi:cell division protein FtsI (penicillin-binding protein 3)